MNATTSFASFFFGGPRVGALYGSEDQMGFLMDSVIVGKFSKISHLSASVSSRLVGWHKAG